MAAHHLSTALLSRTGSHQANTLDMKKALFSLAAAVATLFAGNAARASIAYGSINNFDTVNDTGHECHGFEIEIEDCHSTDVTYTFDWNHYGTPKITQDDSVAGHPKCVIRWESKKNPDGSWAAYTAIPSGPISPTNGHMFTNPAVNFGGEHFGVGYRVAVGAIRYHWLIDDGAGNLIHGGEVQVSTPTFTYFPPVAGAVAQVQAVIEPPEEEAPEPKEFGPAIWMKEIRTTSHTREKVKLRELVSDDPDHPEKKDWRNGEPDEVETEWQLLQREYNKADGGVNGKKDAAPEDLPHGDEVVTRRYEFYKYTGPFDAESGEAMAENVGPDGIHGEGMKTVNGVEVDLSTLEIVGDYTGAQMAAVDVDAVVGLIDHVGEGRQHTAYAARTLVVEGSLPFACTRDGALPAGMTFDEETGVLSGTPTASGQFVFTVTASDGFNADVVKNYTLSIAPSGGELPAAHVLDTAVEPAGAGSTTGDGSYAPGTEVTAEATAAAGWRFVHWTDNGVVVADTATHTLTLDVNHSLVAHFRPDVPQWTVAATADPAEGGSVEGAGTVDDGSVVTLTAAAAPGWAFVKWTEEATVVGSNATLSFTATADRTLTAHFAPLASHTVTTVASPAEGGTVAGAGSYTAGDSATVTATPADGWVFVKWTVGGAQVSTAPSYSFTVTADRTLTAQFVAAGELRTVTTASNPTAGGTTTGAGSYATGDTATVTAVPAPNYAFSRWTESGTTVSTDAAYSFVVNGNRTLTARFTEAIVITVGVSPSVGGEAEMDSDSYKSGERAKAKAFPADGYEFVGWLENGAVVSTDETYSFNVTGPRHLVATFALEGGVTVTASSTPADGGTVTGDGGYFPGDDVWLSASPAEGFAFSHWSVGGVSVSTDADWTFTATENVAAVAHFAPAIVISALASPVDGGEVLGAGAYVDGAEAVLEAVAAVDYIFRNWTENGQIVGTEPVLTVTVDGPREFVANFSPAWSITADAWPVAGGTVAGGGSVAPGESVTLVAAAAPGWSFAGWSDDTGAIASTEASWTFEPTQSAHFTANFSPVLAGIHFNFDSGVPLLALHQPLPLEQTVGTLTATFSSPDAQPPTVETEASSGQVLTNFAAHFLAPSASAGTVLEIAFSEPVTGLSFHFATREDAAVPVGSNLYLTALDLSTPEPATVGTALAHGSTEPGDTCPTGTMTFNSDVPFDAVRIELAAFPAGADGFFLDNLIVTPAGSTGGSMLLANPNWNITLSDFGYSDYLLDNTPGFEGREYLSGEWGTAISYTRDGVPVAPTWLEPQFLFPDWTTNSDFRVVEGIHFVGTNADGLAIAQSVVANDDVEITLSFEMLDTVTGTPMGLTPASTAGSDHVLSNRYVLQEGWRVRNLSGVTLENVRVYQMLHGLVSQRGVQDDHAHPGRLSQYRHDTTLAGVDGSSAGQGSSDVGLEDYIAFHSRVAPDAFEIGHYGIEGNGIDDHSVGKPSDGVHLSIEADWQGEPWSTRQGRASFAPADPWVAGAQRWTLGTLAPGQSAQMDILLSLLTGTKVVTNGGGGGGGGGNSGHGSCNGGSSHPGGVDFEFDDISEDGTFFGDYAEADDDELFEWENEGHFPAPNFLLPGGPAQLWNLEFTGTHQGAIRLTFGYDASSLPAGFDQTRLAIHHFDGTAWVRLAGTVDVATQRISVTTPNLSPFMLGVAPDEPPLIGADIFRDQGGTVTGGGNLAAGTIATLHATAAAGWEFTGWWENGAEIATTEELSFTVAADRFLTASFRPVLVMEQGAPSPGSTQVTWPADADGWVLEMSADLTTWEPATELPTTGNRRAAVLPTEPGRCFVRLVHP